MSTKCEISYCKWTGPTDELFDHFETYHNHLKREIINESHFEFTLDDLQREPFLLCGENGLYWFKMKPTEDESELARGIFGIGESEITKYHIKIGTLATMRTEIRGPFHTQPENSQQFDFRMPFEYLAYLTTRITPTVVIYFGEFNDDDDVYTGSWDDIDWTDQREVDQNNKLLEMFTCSICLEHIRKDARFCENKHYLCEKCLNELFVHNKKAICPQCRQPIWYNSRSDDIEKLLKLLRFPNTTTNP